MISQNSLKEILSYDAETGVFRWIKSRGNQFSAAGTEAGWIGGEGYRKIEINGKSYGAHRLAWLYETGAWPLQEIDHKNGSKSDNRFCNLRDVSKMRNQHNRRVQSTSTTGLLGVKRNGSSYAAAISYNGTRLHLGTFKTPQLAHDAYMAAKFKLHGEEFCLPHA